MNVKGWRLYNHAAIPSIPPHENPDIRPIENKSIWRLGSSGEPLFARWTTEFDCGYETNWWYVIKDEPFDIKTLKSKKRYRVNKGVKNFEVRRIQANEYKEELYHISVEAYKTYPKKYRPSINHVEFISSIEKWKYIVYGAFYRETNELCGYTLLENFDSYISLSVVKVNPKYENHEINAALIYQILNDYQDFFLAGGYICDGSRNISHETGYQDYLEKVFHFKKAYCNLHIVYNPNIKWIVKMIYPFRKVFLKLDNIRLIHQINSILKMEAVVRNENG